MEVRLGQARLEGDIDQVLDIETELAQTQAYMKPSLKLETSYPEQLEESAFHGLAGEIVKAIEPHSEADSVALLINLLTGFGNLIGCGSWFMVGTDRHFFKICA